MVDAVQLEATSGGGVRMRIRVKPGGRRERLVGPHGGALKIEVSAAPEKGRANAAVLALLAGICGVSSSEVRLVSGQTSRDKLVEIDLAAAEVVRRLGERDVPARAARARQ